MYKEDKSGAAVPSKYLQLNSLIKKKKYYSHVIRKLQ